MVRWNSVRRSERARYVDRRIRDRAAGEAGVGASASSMYRQRVLAIAGAGWPYPLGAPPGSGG